MGRYTDQPNGWTVGGRERYPAFAGIARPNRRSSLSSILGPAVRSRRARRFHQLAAKRRHSGECRGDVCLLTGVPVTHYFGLCSVTVCQLAGPHGIIDRTGGLVRSHWPTRTEWSCDVV